MRGEKILGKASIKTLDGELPGKNKHPRRAKVSGHSRKRCEISFSREFYSKLYEAQSASSILKQRRSL
jgi:hypothetical protein